MRNTPAVVEEVIVVLHEDTGLHNIILSSANPTVVEAINYWDSVPAHYTPPWTTLPGVYQSDEFGAKYPLAP
jgi:hypothetical protein